MINSSSLFTKWAYEIALVLFTKIAFQFYVSFMGFIFGPDESTQEHYSVDDSDDDDDLLPALKLDIQEAM